MYYLLYDAQEGKKKRATLQGEGGSPSDGVRSSFLGDSAGHPAGMRPHRGGTAADGGRRTVRGASRRSWIVRPARGGSVRGPDALDGAGESRRQERVASQRPVGGCSRCVGEGKQARCQNPKPVARWRANPMTESDLREKQSTSRGAVTLRTLL